MTTTTRTVCSIQGCGTGGRIIRGWCSKHYARYLQHGDPLRGPLTPDERFDSKVLKSQDGHTYFTGFLRGGYGQFWDGSKTVGAHRYAWERAYGPIPDGMVIDHVCHNEAAARGECDGGVACTHRSCVRIEHLALATCKENNLSSPMGAAALNAQKTTCPRGHPYGSGNLMVRAAGGRNCRACHRENQRRSDGVLIPEVPGQLVMT